MIRLFIGIFAGIFLHIAALETADLILVSRAIKCTRGSDSACWALLNGEQTFFETVAKARPNLGLKRWQAFVRSLTTEKTQK